MPAAAAIPVDGFSDVGAGGVGPGGAVRAEGVTPDQRTYAVFMHLSLLLLHVLGPLSFLVPLVMWLTRREGSAFLDDHGRETVNFHLTVTLYAVLAVVLVPACFVGVPLIAGVYALGIVGAVRACRAANRDEYYRYPMCLRVLRG
jgi:uncharacterized Tic20 family protein